MNKKKKIIIFIVVFIILIVGCTISLYFKLNKKIEGKFTYSSLASDDRYGVEINSPILIREVEMVQYYKDENGKVELVFANYPIESFDNYNNPNFPEEIKSEVFYSEDIKFNDYELSEDVIDAIAYSDIDKLEITELQVNDVLEDNLVCVDNALVSASNEWQLGEIRITYKYIDPSKEYSINSSTKGNQIIYTKLFNIESK